MAGKCKSVIWLMLSLLLSSGTAIPGTVNFLTDIKVVYIYDLPENIDWALVYHLSLENGCDVDLATVKKGPVYRRLFNEIPEYNVTVSRFFIPDTSQFYMDTVTDKLFGEYPPDIIIFNDSFEKTELKIYGNFLLNYEIDSVGVSTIRKFYRRSEKGTVHSVHLKAKQYYDNYYTEISKMVTAVTSQPLLTGPREIYTNYDLIKSSIAGGEEIRPFLSGLERFKFDRLVESEIGSTVKQDALKMNRKKYVEYLENAIKQIGADRIESLIAAREELKKIRETYYYQLGEVDKTTPVAKYIDETLEGFSRAIFFETGIDYNGTIIIRETAEGKKLKFISEISNNGYLDIKAGWLALRPFRDDKELIIDSGWTVVLPNNSLIREYTVDIDPVKLESATEESFRFIGRVNFAGSDIDFVYRSGGLQPTGFRVEFVPDFLMIKPFEELQVDRLVEPAAIKAVISKPTDYSGTVDVDISAPLNILAGAYRDKLTLHSGEHAAEIKIPLVATKSMGPRRHEMTITISADGKQLASDVAFVRQAEFKIPPQMHIAVLPDNSGVLEDILITAGANYKIVSERYLKSGDFNLYDVVLFGTGCFQDYKSLELFYDKTKKYMENGGKVIVFGQPDEWRDDLLPVSLITAERSITGEEITVKKPKHGLFTKEDNIDISALSRSMSGNYISYPAVVFPGEIIMEAGGKTALLSISGFGKGKLIYCGMPLAEMIADLDLEAIGFFSNLINF